MRLDPDALANGTTLHADVAVVGSGPAGITVATALAARGHHVVVLEAGGDEHRHADDVALRGRCAGTPFPLVPSRRRGFGGTSARWQETTGLRARPLDHVDFGPLDARPGTSWPFGRDQLDPYYRQACELVGLRPDFDACGWFPDRTELSWPGGPQRAVFQFADHDVFLRRYTEVVEHPRLELVLGASVVSVDVEPTSGAVARLQVRTEQGTRLGVRASVYVLAGGAIETVRLLLSSPGTTGAGVGNESRQLGRWFMDHVSIDSGTLVDAHGRPPDVGSFAQRLDPAGIRHQAMLWPGDETVRRHGLLNAAFWLDRSDETYLSPGVDHARKLRDGLRVTPHLPHLGADVVGAVRGGADVARYALHRLGRGHPRETVVLRVLSEVAPRSSWRLALDHRRDALGRARVLLDCSVGEDDLRMVRRHQDLLAAQLEARGIGTVTGRLDLGEEPPLLQWNHHHVGGARMHVDPRCGVVDAECRVHSARNLYVASSAVFPAGGYLNPTLTIIALALRIARRVDRALAPATVTTPADPG